MSLAQVYRTLVFESQTEILSSYIPYCETTVDQLELMNALKVSMISHEVAFM